MLATLLALGACGPARETAPAPGPMDALQLPPETPTVGLQPVKVHGLEAAAHPAVEPSLPAAGLPLRRAAPTRRLTHKVYGYYPYWSSGWQHLRFELLSTLAYFSSGLSERGVITSSNGWGGATVNALVAAARAAGVRVVQTITNFDDAAIGRLLADPARRDTAITNIIAEVRRGGGEGVNIDFEFVPLAQKAAFVTFMSDLTERMHAAIPGSEVTLAAPSIDWSGAYDYDQLALRTDGLMIMAYGYHWTGGAPGPLSPLRSPAPWTGRDLTWTVDDYLRNGATADKLILGLPFYGIDWPATSDAVPGARVSSTAAGNGRSVFYKNARLDAQRYGRRWDAASSTPYYVYAADGGWRQGFYDDAESLDAKLQLIKDRGLAGVGIWALAYDGDRAELFDVISRKLSEPVASDGGPSDGGATGGGPTDGGPVEVVAPGDGGFTTDAGAQGGAGLPTDGGAGDGGATATGEQPRPGGGATAGGCGAAGEAAPGWLVLAAWAGVALSSRRRRSRPLRAPSRSSPGAGAR